MNPGRKESARIRKSVWYVGPIISPFVSRYTEGSAVAWVNRALHRGKGKGPSTVARLPTGEARIGKRVRIRANHRRWPLRGLEGAIDKRWGNPDHVALDVLLDDGRSELFWYHELEEIAERLSSGTEAHRKDRGEGAPSVGGG
jgi:hypothetical protein